MDLVDGLEEHIQIHHKFDVHNLDVFMDLINYQEIVVLVVEVVHKQQ